MSTPHVQPAPVLTPLQLDTLTTALRVRSSTVAELAAVTQIAGAQLEPALATLAGLGFLGITEGVVTYRSPAAAFTHFTQSSIGAAQATLETLLGQTHELLERLPELQTAWELGKADEHRLDVEVFHGPYAPADIWLAQSSRRVPVSSKVMMPSTGPLFASSPVHQASFWAHQAGDDIQVKLIMSTADATNPDAQAQIRTELDAGVQIRMHPNPPSWCWITDDDTAGIPLEWGQEWPTSVMSVRSPAVAEAVGWIFDRVWEQSVAVDTTEHPWESLLFLMQRGMTMEAATRTLGLAERTGRRRVSAAMLHYGVDTPFALGAAWQAEQGRRAAATA